MLWVFWITAAALCAGISAETDEMTIDDFQTLDSSANSNFERKCFGSVMPVLGAFVIPPKSRIEENFTKPLNIEEMAFKIIYSTETTGSTIMSLRTKNGIRRVKIDDVGIPLEKGAGRGRIVPASDFKHADLSKATGIIIRGPMTIHQIKLIKYDNIASPSFHTDVTPAILIDDFKHWSEPNKNKIKKERQLSGSIPLRSESVYLLKPEDHVQEIFADKSAPLDMQHLAFRIRYSTPVTIQCAVGLHVTTYIGDDKIVYNPNPPNFVHGKVVEIIVLGSTFIQPGSQSESVYGWGITIFGPLVVHRVELILNPLEYEMRLPTHASFDPETQSLTRRTQYFKSVLQLVSVPITLKVNVHKRKALKTALDLMKFGTFNMDLDIYFPLELFHDKTHNKRVFFDLLKNEITASEIRLFANTKDAKKLLHIVPEPKPNPVRLQLYRLVGQILGMAILNQELRSLKFEPLVYRVLAGKYVLNSEIRKLMPPMPSSSHAGGEKQTMSVTYTNPILGTNEVVDLIPNGRDIEVNDDNKEVFSNAYSKWYFNRYMYAQAGALRVGIRMVIPSFLLDELDGNELAYIMTGDDQYASVQ